MDAVISVIPFIVALFGGMILCLEFGRKLGLRRLKDDPKEAMTGFGAIGGAVFGLYGLLVAFTFHGATERFDDRRHLITEESNAIGTAYLRVDLLPAEYQPAMRDLFRKYLDSRLEVYRRFPNLDAVKAGLAASAVIQEEIWKEAVAASRLPGAHPDAGKLLLPALNAMIDITTTRAMVLQMHPPTVLFVLLFVLALACSLLAGIGMAPTRNRSWLHNLIFTGITVVTIYVCLDMEYPRMGFIRVDSFDQVLMDLKDSMK